jgi:hypothetical protein
MNYLKAEEFISYKAGIIAERKRIRKMLDDYFALTHEPNDNNKTEENLEWDRGFQAALSLLNNPYNSERLDK